LDERFGFGAHFCSLCNKVSNCFGNPCKQMTARTQARSAFAAAVCEYGRLFASLEEFAGCLPMMRC
jgi:hypothetical protein